jgi:hypothetical protein
VLGKHCRQSQKSRLERAGSSAIDFNGQCAAIPSIRLKPHGLRSHRQVSGFLTNFLLSGTGVRAESLLPELSSPFFRSAAKGQPNRGQTKGRKINMKAQNLIHILGAIVCFALSPQTQAVNQPHTPDPGALPGSNTADGGTAPLRALPPVYTTRRSGGIRSRPTQTVTTTQVSAVGRCLATLRIAKQPLAQARFSPTPPVRATPVAAHSRYLATSPATATSRWAQTPESILPLATIISISAILVLRVNQA